MEDNPGRVYGKNHGKYPVPSRLNCLVNDTHRSRRHTKSFDSSYFENQRFNMGRNQYDLARYQDVFGGPPKCISSRIKAEEQLSNQRRSFDDVFKAFEHELNLTRDFKSSPVFELPVHGNSSSWPVFELPVFGGSEFPVFELSQSREDLDSRGTTPKSSNAEFYDYIFKSGRRISSSMNEESTIQSIFSRPSRSRSKSSSSQLSSEEPSPHHNAMAWIGGDPSLSAVASKLRPIPLSSRRSRSFVFSPLGPQHPGYQSHCSDNVSVVSSACSSPSQVFSDTASNPCYRFGKARVFGERMDRQSTNDVFGGFPQRKHSTHMQSSQKEGESGSEFKNGSTLENIDKTSRFEKCPVLQNPLRKTSVKYIYEIADHVDGLTNGDQMDSVSQVLEPGKESSLLIDTVTTNLFGSTSTDHLDSPQTVKSWRDWLPELNNSQFYPKRDSSSISSMASSNICPITDTTAWAQEELEEFRLEDLGRNVQDDKESSVVNGSYVIEIVPGRRKNLVFHNKNDNHEDDSSIHDASEIALQEAIAWAKEKYQLGSSKENNENAHSFAEEPNDKDTKMLVCSGNAAYVRQGGNDTSMNEEKRLEKICNESLPEQTPLMSENHRQGLINQPGHRTDYDDQLSICKKQKEKLSQKQYLGLLASQCASTDSEESLTWEVTNGAIMDYNQHTTRQDGVDPFTSSPALQDTCEMDTTPDIVCSGRANQMDFSTLLEEWACYELERWKFQVQSADFQTSQYKGDFTAATSSDKQTVRVKEIPLRTTLSDQQWENKHMEAWAAFNSQDNS